MVTHSDIHLVTCKVMKEWVQVPQHSQKNNGDGSLIRLKPWIVIPTIVGSIPIRYPKNYMENELLLGTITLIGALSVILYIGYDVWTM